MKSQISYVLAMLVMGLLCLNSCKDDSGSEVKLDSTQLLMDHLTDIDMDLNHVIKNSAGQKFVMGAPADGNLSAKYIIDIRNSTDFGDNHITGAHNIAFTEILDEAAKAGSTPILVVCYTGQTACYATSLLRLYGYQDAMALKWGMSGWHTTTDKWTAQIADLADGHNNWSYGNAPDKVTHSNPEFTTTATTGTAILKERVELAVAQGFKTASAADVLATPTDYFVNNYFSTTDYTAFGHIDGAQRLLPLLIKPLEAGDASMNNINPSSKVVTYCYTGQTSAVVTAYLRVLGYDAYSLTFGMNKLFNHEDSWTVNQWGGDSNSKTLPMVSGM